MTAENRVMYDLGYDREPFMWVGQCIIDTYTGRVLHHPEQTATPHAKVVVNGVNLLLQVVEGKWFDRIKLNVKVLELISENDEQLKTCQMGYEQEEPQYGGEFVEEEVDDAASGKALGGRDGQGCRKGPNVTTRDAKKAGRIELGPEDLSHPTHLTANLTRADGEDCVVVVETRFESDVQAGKRVEYLQAGQQQKEQADGPDPVRDPRDQPLAVNEWSVWHGNPSGLAESYATAPQKVSPHRAVQR